MGCPAKERTCAPAETTHKLRFRFRAGAGARLELFRRLKIICVQKFTPSTRVEIVGLDAVLEGGWARNRLHLLEGSPGTGKTTIACNF